MTTTRIIRRRRSFIDYSLIDEKMKLISELDARMAKDAKDRADAVAELLARMKEVSLHEHRVDDLVATRYQPSGKASTYIDPKKFRAAVPNDDDFYSAISVGVTAAKKVLSEKALLRIAKVTPGTPGPETVKVEHVKVK